MTSNVGDIIAQLADARERLAAAAVTAMRARADAEQAGSHLTEAANGTDHRDIRAAISDVAIAGDKATKVARQLEQARDHFAKYLNRISPGSVLEGDGLDNAMPSGERLLAEAERRGRRADIAWRKQVQSAADGSDSLKSTEKGIKGVVDYILQQRTPPEAMTASTAEPDTPAFTQQKPTPPENPIAAAAMAAAALATVSKVMWDHAKTQRARKRENDNQP